MPRQPAAWEQGPGLRRAVGLCGRVCGLGGNRVSRMAERARLLENSRCLLSQTPRGARGVHVGRCFALLWETVLIGSWTDLKVFIAMLI